MLCGTLAASAEISPTDSIPAPQDTTATDTARTSPFTFDGYLYSRYIWRGVNFGGCPSIQGQLAYTNGGFTVGTFVAKSLNGQSVGFANTSNVFVSYKYKGVSLTMDDYFFYDEDNLDRYLDWSDTTLHFIEARLRYDGTRCYGFVGYNVYGADGINKDALYIEVGYKFPKDDLTVFAGFLTDKSDLNFATSGGVTNIGITKEKKNVIGKLPVTGSLVLNPNYENIVDLPGVKRSFLTLVIGTSF